jgi:hypothetical protein
LNAAISIRSLNVTGTSVARFYHNDGSNPQRTNASIEFDAVLDRNIDRNR